MGTPCAVGVYQGTGPAPDQVEDRPWTGVYVNYDGDPAGAGNRLLGLVRTLGGDLDAWIAEVVTAHPGGWAALLDRPLDNPDPPVGPGSDLDRVAFCYVLDREARRLDVFATHVEARGERIVSATLGHDGVPTPGWLDLEPEEQVEDGARPDPTAEPLSAAAVETLFARHLPQRWGPFDLNVRGWVEDGADLRARVLVVERDRQGEVRGVAEAEPCIVTMADRRDPERVSAFVSAWATAAVDVRDLLQERDYPGMAIDLAARMFGRDLLARARARTPENLVRVLGADTHLGLLRRLAALGPHSRLGAYLATRTEQGIGRPQALEELEAELLERVRSAGGTGTLEVCFDPEQAEFQVIRWRTVVAEASDADREIALADATALAGEGWEVGDTFGDLLESRPYPFD